jgi:hypothetical protein
MARQLGFDFPGDESILTSVATLMVEKAFEAKVSF